MSSNDTNPTNESNEAYERRMAIKELMSAPQGTRFQWRARFTDVPFASWPDREPEWNFGLYDYRIAPQPKKVLKRWVEIFQLESKHPERTFLSLGVIALAKENLDKMAGKTREEIPGSETFPDEWFTEASK
jgi:hypothetical protein